VALNRKMNITVVISFSLCLVMISDMFGLIKSMSYSFISVFTVVHTKSY